MMSNFMKILEKSLEPTDKAITELQIFLNNNTLEVPKKLEENINFCCGLWYALSILCKSLDVDEEIRKNALIIYQSFDVVKHNLERMEKKPCLLELEDVLQKLRNSFLTLDQLSSWLHELISKGGN